MNEDARRLVRVLQDLRHEAVVDCSQSLQVGLDRAIRLARVVAGDEDGAAQTGGERS